MLQEDISVGQAVRSFVIYELSDTSETWIKLYENTGGIGNKKIVLFNQHISPPKLRVVITKAAIPTFGAITVSAFDPTKCIPQVIGSC